MAEFSRIPISELVASGEAELKTGPFGTQLKASEYTERGTPVINVRNIGFGSIKVDRVEFISPTTRERLSSHLLRRGDIVFGRKGAVERHVFIRQEQDGWFQGSDCLRLRFVSRRVEPLFASYYFLTTDHQRWMMNQCSHGATMASLNQGILERIELPLPPLPVQKRIAGILSAYDELIENSQRRIKILESMACALYREWFVHFRFPGHENHPRVASALGEIPQGWKVKKLGDIITVHIGGGWGKEAPDDKHSEPALVIRGTDIPMVRYAQMTGVPYRVHSTSNLRSRRLTAGDIVFEVSGGSKGQPVGRTLLITSELLASVAGDVICASFCKRIQPDLQGYGSELLYLSFIEGYESGEIEQYQVQSTGISNFKWTEYIAHTDRVIPPAELREQFRGHVVPLFSQVATLGRKIHNLRLTRDLLLPRLLSGQIEARLPEP
ncbi:MAG: restriction endonuclease subunit S [Nitrospira sp.]|jgi:type I restriction enzyme S subunit|nr:restriction endonuclease subunit S [Nitrospira sp.]